MKEEYEIVKGFNSNGKYLYIVMEHGHAHIMEEWEIRSMYNKWHPERRKMPLEKKHVRRNRDGRIVLGENASTGKGKTHQGWRI